MIYLRRLVVSALRVRDRPQRPRRHIYGLLSGVCLFIYFNFNIKKYCAEQTLFARTVFTNVIKSKTEIKNCNNKYLVNTELKTYCQKSVTKGN